MKNRHILINGEEVPLFYGDTITSKDIKELLKQYTKIAIKTDRKLLLGTKRGKETIVVSKIKTDKTTCKMLRGFYEKGQCYLT